MMNVDAGAPATRLQLIIFAAAVSVLAASCGTARSPAAPDGTGSAAPPLHQSEGVVVRETAAGQAAAELVAQPVEIAPDGSVVLCLENRGEVRLVYGRPITVERWNGSAWEETDESRSTAWTMDAILTEPGERGLEQRWPFHEGSLPEPGWYRFTKRVQTDAPSDASENFVVRARVQVRER